MTLKQKLVQDVKDLKPGLKLEGFNFLRLFFLLLPLTLLIILKGEVWPILILGILVLPYWWLVDKIFEYYAEKLGYERYHEI